jgi:hypothetical protein
MGAAGFFDAMMAAAVFAAAMEIGRGRDDEDEDFPPSSFSVSLVAIAQKFAMSTQ